MSVTNIYLIRVNNQSNIFKDIYQIKYFKPIFKQQYTIEGINLNKIPADWVLSKKHRKARKTKPELPFDNLYKYADVCECCGYEIVNCQFSKNSLLKMTYIKREKINICVPIIELGFLGAGFPLFYSFIKYCCIMLGFLFIIQGIPNIIKHIQGSFCNKTMLQFYEEVKENKLEINHFIQIYILKIPQLFLINILQILQLHPKDDFIIPCPASFTNDLSIANVLDLHKGQGSISIHYSTIAMIFQIIILIFFRMNQKEIENKVDDQFITPSDFTIMVKDIPQIQNVEQELRNLFQRNHNIKKIVQVYDTSEIVNLENKMKEIIEKKQNLQIKNHGYSGYPEEQEIENEIRNLEQNIQLLKNDILSIPQKFTGIAFVSFEYQSGKQFKKYLNLFQEPTFQNSHLL